MGSERIFQRPSGVIWPFYGGARKFQQKTGERDPSISGAIFDFWLASVVLLHNTSACSGGFELLFSLSRLTLYRYLLNPHRRFHRLLSMVEPGTSESSKKRSLESDSLTVHDVKRSKTADEQASGGGKTKRANVGPKDGRRDRRGTRGTRNMEVVGDDTAKTPRLPKRQCALLIGFCGTGCNGMQMCVCVCEKHL